MVDIIFPNGSKLSDLLKLTGGTLTSTLIATHIYPVTDATYSLGDATHYWTGLYVDGVNLSNQSTTVTNTSGNIRFHVATGKKFVFEVG